MSRLRLVDDQDNGGGLRDQVTGIIQGHEKEVIETVRRWLVYGVQLGARHLDLNDCPTITVRDYDYVINWLRLEGFSVHQTPGRGRVIVNLEPDAHPGSRPRKRRRFF